MIKCVVSVVFVLRSAPSLRCLSSASFEGDSGVLQQSKPSADALIYSLLFFQEKSNHQIRPRCSSTV